MSAPTGPSERPEGFTPAQASPSAADRAPVAGPSTDPAPAGWRTLDSRSLAASSVLSLAIAVPVTLAVLRFANGQHWPMFWIVAACAAALVLVIISVLTYDLLRLRTTTWRLTAERLELRSGIAVRQHRSIPRDRVRSVDLKADPVRRVLGLSVVKVGTGEHNAGGDSTLTLDPLSRTEAEHLRGVLLHSEHHAAEGTAAEQGPLSSFDWSWTRFAPLTVWSFIGAALVVGIVSKPLGWLGIDLWDNAVRQAAWGWLTADPWLRVPLILLANVLLGVVGAAVVFAVQWGNYRLEEEPGRLKLSRGLLTTRSLTMEERRLRGVELSEPLLARLGGAARLKVVATGLKRKAEENESAEDLSALTPPLPRADAVRLADHFTGGPLPRLHPHPPAARAKRVRMSLIEVAVIVAALAAADWLWLPSWVWAALIAYVPFTLWHARADYRALGNALAPRHLITRMGVSNLRTVALERKGIIGWEIKQSYFQRRLGLITVRATTAAGAGHYDVVDVGQDHGLELAGEAVPGLLEPFVVR
ncbi:PH domain-containing protein [Nonomuraea sp. NPDC050663]|uniref:PH domain-containing protein n=1 Tax=Nonomuraea sp. NPDC050663 TaxID=3364370 RepID=UPI0037A72154